MHYQSQHWFKWAKCCSILLHLAILKKLGWFFLWSGVEDGQFEVLCIYLGRSFVKKNIYNHSLKWPLYQSSEVGWAYVTLILNEKLSHMEVVETEQASHNKLVTECFILQLNYIVKEFQILTLERQLWIFYYDSLYSWLDELIRVFAQENLLKCFCCIVAPRDLHSGCLFRCSNAYLGIRR